MEESPHSNVQHLVESLPRRVETVIAAKGEIVDELVSTYFGSSSVAPFESRMNETLFGCMCSYDQYSFRAVLGGTCHTQSTLFPV